jgi:NAD(P)H-dependent FMN reductase
MTKIAVILGSTRPGRNGEAVARWVLGNAAGREGATYELVDLADYPLPHLDEPMPAMMGQYTQEHTRAWSEKIAGYDGYVFVTPEYNHSTSGVLKNALDYLSAEWANKAAGFVSYGTVGGVRAVEHLRLIAAELHMATVRGQAALSLFTDFENFSDFKPGAHQAQSLEDMFTQLETWAKALAPLRATEPAAA